MSYNCFIRKHILLNYRIKAPILMEKHNFSSKTTKERVTIIFCNSVIWI